jgi:ABC-type protease/lipase transport system fused ATPase/permease subunit
MVFSLDIADFLLSSRPVEARVAFTIKVMLLNDLQGVLLDALRPTLMMIRSTSSGQYDAPLLVSVITSIRCPIASQYHHINKMPHC